MAKNDLNGLNVSTSDQPYLISIEDNILAFNGINIYPLKKEKTYLA